MHGPCDRFIEIGKRDVITNGRLDMAPFLHSVTFAACDLNTILQHDPAWTYNLLQGAMELWQLGVFRPTSLFTTFKYSQLETAFRQLQSGRHGGKVVLTIDDDAVVEALPWSPLPHQFQEDATYLLSGGLGGLGRSAARWMASHGAKHFLFLSRSGGSNADAQLLLNELKTPDVMRRSFGLTLVTRLPCIKRSNLMPKNAPYPGLHSRRDDIDSMFPCSKLRRGLLIIFLPRILPLKL